MTETPKAKRGFAAMTPEQRREISSRAGKATKPENRYFARNPEAAADAGRKGGAAAFLRNRKP